MDESEARHCETGNLPIVSTSSEVISSGMGAKAKQGLVCWKPYACPAMGGSAVDWYLMNGSGITAREGHGGMILWTVHGDDAGENVAPEAALRDLIYLQSASVMSAKGKRLLRRMCFHRICIGVAVSM